ncbi:acyl-CoA dehydrogenase family protein [Chloroflexota bacterium]
MDFTIPEELIQLKMLVRRFVQEELLPLEKEVEENDELPQEIRVRLRQKALNLGLRNFHIPVEYGGVGVGALGQKNLKSKFVYGRSN